MMNGLCLNGVAMMGNIHQVKRLISITGCFALLYLNLILGQHQVTKQISKKEHNKKKPTDDEGHYEGKYWCNCRIRNYRRWLGKKKFGDQFDQITGLLPCHPEVQAEVGEGEEPCQEARNNAELGDE